MKEFDLTIESMRLWKSFEPLYWKHRSGKWILDNTVQTLCTYVAELEHMNEFERKIRLGQCRQVLGNIRHIVQVYDLSSEPDCKIYSDKVLSFCHHLIIHLTKPKK
jgi:hypothetical protein